MKQLQQISKVMAMLFAPVLLSLLLGIMSASSGSAVAAQARRVPAARLNPSTVAELQRTSATLRQARKHMPLSTQHHGAKLSVFPNKVNPNNTLTITGGGFTPGGGVDVYQDAIFVGTFFADAHGNISATSNAPATPGRYQASAIDDFTATAATTTFTVIGPGSLNGVSHPRISVQPGTVNPSDNITILGSGFTPGGAAEVYTTSIGYVGEFQVDNQGNFSAVISANDIPGTNRLTVLDFSTSGIASTTYQVR